VTSLNDRAASFLEGASRQKREIVTPEGVSLVVELADPGERITAFILDFLFSTLASIFLYLLLIPFALSGVTLTVALGIVLFIAFVIRNLYFIHFELAWRGATPGKHLLNLRVIDRRGGPLRPGAVIARNLTREIEIFLPIGLLNSLNGALWHGVLWERLSLIAWILLLAALPLFNRDRLRAGDLIAGTMVIAMPRRNLTRDLVDTDLEYRFTSQQLRAYGTFELQVLEELLRHPDAPDAKRVRREVCDKIRAKIGFPAPVQDANVDLFLSDFYTAERAFLEREQLFGRRRADKNDPGSSPRG
jgi:uncharacterized RDD family membrane protein YckC